VELKPFISHSLELRDGRESHLSDILQSPDELFFSNFHSFCELQLLLITIEVRTPVQPTYSSSEATVDGVSGLLGGHLDTVVNSINFENKFSIHSLISTLNLFFS
jgi:hypothetical protein